MVKKILVSKIVDSLIYLIRIHNHDRVVNNVNFRVRLRVKTNE